MVAKKTEMTPEHLNDEENSLNHESKIQPETKNEQPDNVVPDVSAANSPQVVVGKNRQHRFLGWFMGHKLITGILAVTLMLGLLTAVPWTRYKIAGLLLKQTTLITVVDSQTHRPVPNATVSVAKIAEQTNSFGQVRLRLKVGKQHFQVSKPYYQTVSGTLLTPILKPKDAINVSFKATGRHVPISVTNVVTGKSLSGVKVQAGNATTTTAPDGKATLVLPADKQTVTATISANGYNAKTVTINVTEAVSPANSYQLTPAGKLYFLSNRSGTIDVVKSDLDGANRQTVLGGTGKEDVNNTVLLASRDWKYLALLSKRDGGSSAKLFLITTATDTVSTMDEGDATFGIVGWSDHRFVYDVNRNAVPAYQPAHQVLKSFNADNQSIAILDQNDASGSIGSYQQQRFVSYTIINNQVIYITQWDSYAGSNAGKQITIRTVADTGANKKDLRSFDATQYWTYPRVIPEAQGIYFAIGHNNAPDPQNPYEFYEYENGAVKTANVTSDQLNQAYPTYLQSPSGNQTFWSDVRDGKNSLFVGDSNGLNGKEILSQSEQNAYGWYTDAYVLAAKNGSELYIMSENGGQQLKVTDYYKPQASFRGYGGGYGGL